MPFAAPIYASRPDDTRATVAVNANYRPSNLGFWNAAGLAAEGEGASAGSVQVNALDTFDSSQTAIPPPMRVY